MELQFPPLCGGIIQGLNDPGIETFEGDYAHYVVRECVQNSLDAAASAAPVNMEIAIHYLDAGQLPFLPELQLSLERCRVFWNADEKARRFFDRASRLARGNNIIVLRISDFGTTGVPGDDFNKSSPWFGLVRSRGVSVKNDESSAGAFGIGKDAPLAASQLRTVIYSSRTVVGDVAAQGVCRLATHEVGNKPTQGTGFIGLNDLEDYAFKAVRRNEEIPTLFRRHEPGLDVWVIGFQGETDGWAERFITATLHNFWPAIHFEKLIMRIGHRSINRHTLPDLMREFMNDENVKEAYPYFQSVVGAGTDVREDTLPLAGKCRLHVMLGDHELPRKICMTRKTGMVIYHYRPRDIRIPFAGLFQCDDLHGNQLLKALEPPCHDNWVAKRAKTSEEKGVLPAITTWITSSLKSMIPDLNSDWINEDTLAAVLPDDLPENDGQNNEETDLDGKPSGGEFSQTEMQMPQIRMPGMRREARGNENSGGGEGDTVDPKDGDGKKSGGRMRHTGGDEPNGGAPSATRLQVELRTYLADLTGAAYHLIVRAPNAYQGDLRIDAVSEDGAQIACIMNSALGANGEPFSVSGNRIAGVSIPQNGSIRILITLATPMRVALRASTV